MIEVKNLMKKYGDHIAVKHLDFCLEKGKIYGFLGPNGAGKSTTMNMITGCIAPTQGEVRIGGADIVEQPQTAKRMLGYLPEIPPLYPDMTIREYLDFVMELKEVKKAERKEMGDRLMERLGLTELSHRLIKNLSKGYRQRVGLAQALVGDPEVIILDEPTVGLDPRQMVEIRSLIQELGENHTVILSSHILSEVQEVCDEILIISKGELVAWGTPKELEERFHSVNSIHATIKGTENGAEKILKAIGIGNQFTIQEREEGYVEVEFEATEEQDLRETLFYACAMSKMPIIALSQTQVSLEQVFMELTSEHREENLETAKEETERDDLEQPEEEASESDVDALKKETDIKPQLAHYLLEEEKEEEV